MLKSVNPATGGIIQTYNEFSDEEVEGLIGQVENRWNFWKGTTFAYRANLMKSLAQKLRGSKKELSLLMAAEMGKVLREGEAEIEKCAWVCEYYAENAEKFLENQPVNTGATLAYISFRPLGTILAIMPWNFPFWQVFRFAAPTLMAGNTAILKHAGNVSGCALAIENLFLEAGFPEDVFRTILLGGAKVGPVIRNSSIKAVSLTGSTPAGKSVASVAGSELKKCVLELGGNDPYIVLEDADLQQVAKTCAAGRLLNAGQSCIAAKRFIVVEQVYDRFLDFFVGEMNNARVGNPLLPETTLGPLARPDLRYELHNQVVSSVKKGAKIITGGFIPEGEGAYYPPTVLTGAEPGMAAYNEELFGPVAVVLKAKDLSDAIRIANDTEFGLGAGIFSSDVLKACQIAEKYLEAGCCFVNDFVKSDPRLPFGGIKQSGYGRELSEQGIKEFVNIKTVVIR